MAQRYARVDVEFLHKRTAKTLMRELGPGGPLVFIALILKSKDGVVPGTFTYSTEAVGWEKLGLEDVDMGFTLDQFFKVTGRLKQTSRTPVGRQMNVRLTRYGDWQKDARRYEEATKKARTRAHSTVDTNGTQPGTGEGHIGGPSSTSRSIPLTPREKGTNSRAKGTSPRQRGTSPRQRTQTHHHVCPRCDLAHPDETELAAHLDNVHGLASA